MKSAVCYTVLSILNLLAFVAGVCFLPEEVPIHFDAKMTADVVGTPWVFTALPAAAALISAGIFTASVAAKKHKKLISAILIFLGAWLAVMGWCFFALASRGTEIGAQASFPVLLVTVLPISFMLIALGEFLPRVEKNPYFGVRTADTMKSEEAWKKANALSGRLFQIFGILSSAAAIVFSCFPALDFLIYLPIVLLAGGAVLSVLISALAARGAAKRAERKDSSRETP